MKNRKNKKVVLASAIVLGITAITSSALAAYIITGGDLKGEGKVTNTPVKVNNQVADLQDPVVNGSLQFYPDEQITDGKYINTEEEDIGSLSITVDLTIKAAKKSAIKDMTVTITAANTDAITKGYILLPGDDEKEKLATSTVDISASLFNGAENGNTVVDFTQTITLEWSWGDAIGNMDPASYLNANASSASAAAETMADFEAAVNAIDKFTLTFAEKASA